MKAFITGVSGQGGSYLAELLLEKGYKVHGMVRRSSYKNHRLDILDKVELHYGDMLDAGNLHELISKIKPDEIYNLAAQSDVKVSFEAPEYTANVNGLGFLRLLEAVKEKHPKAKVYQASTSEMFGNAPAPQNEDTVLSPRSPYGASKIFAHHMAKYYREAYGIFAVSGILFNHESPRRGTEFVTRKITQAVANIKKGNQKTLELGSLEPKRDWGYAKDYVVGMWLMLQQSNPKDYVLATGQTHTVGEFVKTAFDKVGLDYKKYVVQNPKFMRPAEVNVLQGDPTRAEKELGWKRTVDFEQLIDLMLDEDLK